MPKRKKAKTVRFFLAVVLDILLLMAVLFLMNYAQKLLNSDVKINLTEIVTQNKDVITSKLTMEMNNLDLDAKQVSERYARSEDTSKETLKGIFQEYAKEQKDERLFWADKNGNAVFGNGEEVNVRGRQYFRLAMDGLQNISDRIVSRLDGMDIFVISVPLTYNNKIRGAVMKQYTTQEMYELCSISMFSSQGDMYIINSQGYVLITSEMDEYSSESDNLYRMLYLNDPENSRILKKDIQDNKAGFMEATIKKEKIFSAYTPIEKIYDWYLITSVNTRAVSPNGTIVIQLFYIVLVVVVLFFTVLFGYLSNIKRKQQNHLETLAFTDDLTGGNTYAKFRYELEKMLEKDSENQYNIFTINVDNFKYINLYYGFQMGDAVLKGIYEYFDVKKSTGEWLARIHSDQFVMLLADGSESRMQTFFESEIQIHDITVYLRSGLYRVNNPLENVDLMVDKANSAARNSKAVHYRRMGVYSEDFEKKLMLDEQTKRRVELALANDEIVPYFQPKVDIRNHSLAGAEALARWQTRDGELIPPSQFIPVCEKSDLIMKIDFRIFEKTLHFIRRNLDQGIPCSPISVNFSRMHLFNKDFLNTVLDKLDEYRVPHQFIELELTETIAVDNYKLMQETVNHMHENRVQVAMDDFGTGSSSLQMLKDIPIDVLKIDRSFLLDTVESEKQKAIFGAIVQIAHKLNIKVVVEGVETPENVALMKECECYIAQGYFFAKPMPEQAFQKIYKAGKVL